jgi:hypothetical protein
MSFNREEVRTILSYLNLAGQQAQRLYYKYNDTELLNDAQYDAMCQLCKELFVKYHREAPGVQFTDIVGK